MTPYLLATAIAAVALLVLLLLLARAVVLVRRFGELAGTYRRLLAAESARLEHRRAQLQTELARRRGRTDGGTPRTIR